MNSDFDKIVIYFLDDESNDSLFQKNSTVVTDQDAIKLSADSLNLEGVGVFRKTPLVTLINRFTEKVIDKVESDTYKFAAKFVAFVLLALADPTFFKTAKRLNIFEGEIFSDIDPLFKRDNFGRKYILCDSLSGMDSDSIYSLLEYLHNDKLLTREDDKYFINDEFVLVGVKIKS
jgi:hypothetical protein